MYDVLRGYIVSLMLSTFLSNFSRVVYKVPRINFCTNMAKKSAILLVADGSEEMEVVITADVLRRAGVVLAITNISDSDYVKCSRDVKICTDVKLTDVINSEKYDVVILPGGLAGCKAFVSSAEVGKLLQKQEKENKIIAAICASVTALKAHNIGKGKQITSYPSMKNELADEYKYLEDKVVIDGNLITSRGPATSFDFALAIVEKLFNKETATSVAEKLLYDYI